MADPRPWFPFYISDFWDEPFVRALPHAAVRHYLRMLCDQWLEGHIPQEVAAIAQQTGCTVQDIEPLLHKFPLCEDGFRRNKRVELEKAKAANVSHQRSLAAKVRHKKKISKSTAIAVQSQPQSQPHIKTSPLPPKTGFNLSPYLEVWKRHFGAYPTNPGLLGKLLKPIAGNGDGPQSEVRWSNFVIGVAKNPQYFGSEAKQFTRFAGTPAIYDDPDWHVSARERAETDRLLEGL